MQCDMPLGHDDCDGHSSGDQCDGHKWHGPEVGSAEFGSMEVAQARDLIASLQRQIDALDPCSGIYIASKVRHADRWKALRQGGVPVISTWIDEAGEGETASYADLWIRCISECRACSALIAYIEEGEVFKGGFIEIGAALSAGRPVFVVGPVPGSFVHHPLVTRCVSLNAAIDAAKRKRGGK